MKKSRTIFVWALLCALAVGQLTTVRVSAATSSTDTVIYTGYNKADRFKITLKETSIVLSGFPSTSEYQYVLVSLYKPTTGKTYGQKVYSTKSKITYSIKNMTNGTYYLQIANGSKKDGAFREFMGKARGVKFKIKDGKLTYSKSLAHKGNVASYNANSSCATALEFYSMDDAIAQSTDKEIIDLAKKITKGAKTDYEKMQKIHDWVANNIWFDADNLLGNFTLDNSLPKLDYDALSAIETKRANSMGFSSLTSALLRASGIPAKFVLGYTLPGGDEWNKETIESNVFNHVWNEAYIDGRWVILDTTLDTNNVYKNGKFSKGTGLLTHRYLDPTITAFSLDHKSMIECLYSYLITEILKEAYIPDGLEVVLNGDVDSVLTIPVYMSEQMPIDYREAIEEIPPEEMELSLKFETTDTDLITVNSRTGTVTPKALGTAKVKVTITMDGVSLVKYTTVNVVRPHVEMPDKYSMTMNDDSIPHRVVGLNDLVWTSSNPAIAKVDMYSGKVIPLMPGRVVISVDSIEHDNQAECVVTITK